MLPLEGITIVSLEQAVAAPFATRQLADLGARVIKVERPAGDFARNYDKTVKGMSSHFVWLNRSKESIALDLKNEKSKKILDELISHADVFIQNLAPGATERLGFGNKELKEKYPNLIICGISGYGSFGPYTNRKAYDLLIQCETGLLSITGTEEKPSKTGVSIADIAAGMYAYSGILSAIIQRYKTGEGVVLEVSMLEALGEWMGYPVYFSGYGGEEPKRTDARHATIYPYGPFLSGDNKQVFLAVQNEREWKRFCDVVLKLPELTNDFRFDSNSNRTNHCDELDEIIYQVFQKLKTVEIIERLEKAQIANAKLNTILEFINHPQLKARNRWKEVKTEQGPIKALIPPVTMEGLNPIMNPVPRVGEHTESILEELRNKKSCY